jgi:hypothetical protein
MSKVPLTFEWQSIWRGWINDRQTVVYLHRLKIDFGVKTNCARLTETPEQRANYFPPIHQTHKLCRTHVRHINDRKKAPFDVRQRGEITDGKQSKQDINRQCRLAAIEFGNQLIRMMGGSRYSSALTRFEVINIYDLHPPAHSNNQ